MGLCSSTCMFGVRAMRVSCVGAAQHPYMSNMQCVIDVYFYEKF